MSIKTLLRLIDPKTLVASVLPVLYGSVAAWSLFGKFHFLYMFLMFIALMLVQSAANMFNDYRDFLREGDTEAKGDEKVLVTGDMTPKDVLHWFYFFMGIASGIALILAWFTSFLILLPVIIGALVIYLYSGGPKPICYTPYGEFTAGITMGFLATLTILFVQIGNLPFQAFFLPIPTACFISMLLLSNNLSDWKEDLKAGRRTLPIVLGIEAAETIWLGLLFVMYGSFFVFAFFHMISLLLAALGIATFPFKTIRTLLQTEKQNQNKPVLMQLASFAGLRFHLVIIILLLLQKLWTSFHNLPFPF